MNYCKRVENNGVMFISDYRIKNGNIPFKEGKLSDLKEWYLKSNGLGDLLSSTIVDMNIDNYKIVEYKTNNGTKYALGI